MNDGITMTVVQSAQDLPGKFSCVLFPKLSMTYDIVEHLTTVDILEEKIEMALSNDNVPHSTDIRMPK